MEFKNKIVLITGGVSIGAAAAIAFAERGAVVIVSDRNAEGGNKTVDLIQKAGGKAEFFACEVSNYDAVKALIDHIKKAYNRLDIAINNAGIPGTTARTHDYPVDDFERVLKVNTSGVFYGMKAQIPLDVGTRAWRHHQHGFNCWTKRAAQCSGLFCKQARRSRDDQNGGHGIWAKKYPYQCLVSSLYRNTAIRP